MTKLINDEGINQYSTVRKAYERARTLLQNENPDRKELSDLLEVLHKNPEGVDWLRDEEGTNFNNIYKNLRGIVSPGFDYRLVSVEEKADFFYISNVLLGNKVYNISWNKYLLDSGAKHTQEEWLENKSLWMLPDAKIYHATLRALFQGIKHKTGSDKQLFDRLRTIFEKDFVEYPMMTSVSASRGMSMQGMNIDKKGAIKYEADYMIPFNSKGDRCFHGKDYRSDLESLFKGGLEEAEDIYRWVAGIPLALVLTPLGEYSGVVTLGFETGADEGGRYNMLHINANNHKRYKAVARGVSVNASKIKYAKNIFPLPE
ncbi:MAG: hypothetical protein WC852_03485 [Candidatus Nanoarchaeia archaeon]